MLSLVRLTRFRDQRKFEAGCSRFHLSPDIYTKLIETHAHRRSLLRGKLLHAHLITNGLARRTHFAAKLVSFYTECKRLSSARQVFDKIPHSDIRRWIVIVGAYSRCGFYQEALDVFFEMRKEGLLPNQFVIPSALKACGHVFDVHTGKILHSLSLKRCFVSDSFVVSALIDMYSKCGEVDNATKVFDTISEKDSVALNALVSGYAHHGLAEEAFSLVKRMQLVGLKPNIITWNTLIAGFAQKGNEVMASELLQLMADNGIEPDVVSWTTVISGLVQNFRNDAAFSTFRRMLSHGFSPSPATISSLLPACASVANARHGRELHGHAVVIGVDDDIYVRSALIDMYAKSGFLHQARLLFYKMSEKNTATWNSMIFAYANNGCSHEAIQLFTRLEKTEGNTKLDHLTFTAVLTACSHAGMVELGQSLFLLMKQKYNIGPRLEHYACMVDLLGTAGKLEEAYRLIETMPMKPDLFVWGALLGACRKHGNVQLADVAAKQLVELEPRNPGNEILMSSLHAEAGSWGAVARFKKRLNNKTRRFSGCSWIETCG
ncbi:unnamed protein product [Linum tenue]|uniref:Pentatricopeptide repeat-containing protein n=1 Tax=Linum tenue TaxID=586396 RepID=A0AAV0Q4A7_9ROSI|nr:unnamed protein product [Linum tenue]